MLCHYTRHKLVRLILRWACLKFSPQNLHVLVVKSRYCVRFYFDVYLGQLCLLNFESQSDRSHWKWNGVYHFKGVTDIAQVHHFSYTKYCFDDDTP